MTSAADAPHPTERLFEADAYARATDAVVAALAAAEDGAALVALDRTVFYAAGGGQPGDSGRLVWDGGEAAVETTIKGENGVILHKLAVGAVPPRPGATLRGEIDWALRLRHMRMHTALHLLSVVIPLPVTGGQIGAEKGRLDFDMAEPPEDKDALAERLNALVADDRPVTAEWIATEELRARPELVKTMAVAPPMDGDRVRLVRIGGQDGGQDGGALVDLQPCGGTHVARTGEIGRLRLGKIEKKGRQNRRVSVHFEDD